MPSFTTTRQVAAPPETVFAIVLDLGRWPLFRGYGPLPGIAEASLVGPARVGARIRVRNTDGSVHHEVIAHLDPPGRYAVHMELAPPVSYVFAALHEDVRLEAVNGGTRITRTFTWRPHAWWSWPMAALFGGVLLPRAVARHDAAVAATLAG